MNLLDYVRIEESKLQRFRNWYSAQQRQEPDKYLVSLDESEWNEKFLQWLNKIDSNE